MNKIKLISLFLFFSCWNLSVLAITPTPVQRDSVLRIFAAESGLNGFSILGSDDFRWVDTACSHQNSPPYTADRWYPVYLRIGDTLVAGDPGQSAYYTITKYFDSLKPLPLGKELYWKLLQVPPHPKYGYRNSVAYYVVDADSTVALIGKALVNTSFGNGGGWQFYIPEYSTALRRIRKEDF